MTPVLAGAVAGAACGAVAALLTLWAVNVVAARAGERYLLEQARRRV